jgi:hypothetical protein
MAANGPSSQRIHANPASTARTPRTFTGPARELIAGDANLNLVIGRSAHAQVALASLLAYPSGIVLDIRYSASGAGDDPVGQVGLPVVTIEYPGGVAVSSDSLIERAFESEVLAVREHGGGAGPGHGDWEYWMSPLPGAGELLLSCQWPAAGIEDTVTAVDTTIIREAAARARPANRQL